MSSNSVQIAKQFNQVVFSLYSKLVILISYYSYHERIRLRGGICVYFHLFMMLSPQVVKLVWIKYELA